MALSHIGTFAHQNFLSSQRSVLQSRLAAAQVQIATGDKAQTFGALGGQSGQLVSLESTLVRTRQFVDGNEAIDRRLQSMETAVASMFDVMTEFRASLVQASNSAVSGNLELPVVAQQLLEQFASLVNTDQEGRHLFSGSRTDTAPVDLSDPGFTVPPATYPSTANMTYYQGNTQVLTVRAEESLTIEYGVTGDNSAFEQAMRSLHLTATNPGLDQARISEALRLAEISIEELANVRSQIGTDRASLATASAALDETALYTEEIIGEIKLVDITEAFTRLQQDQVALQASFSALAQARSVSLLNYL